MTSVSHVSDHCECSQNIFYWVVFINSWGSLSNARLISLESEGCFVLLGKIREAIYGMASRLHWWRRIFDCFLLEDILHSLGWHMVYINTFGPKSIEQWLLFKLWMPGNQGTSGSVKVWWEARVLAHSWINICWGTWEISHYLILSIVWELRQGQGGSTAMVVAGLLSSLCF